MNKRLLWFIPFLFLFALISFLVINFGASDSLKQETIFFSVKDLKDSNFDYSLIDENKLVFVFGSNVPEDVVVWFNDNCLSYYEPNQEYYGFSGYGFYPNYKRIVLENGITEFETEFWVHSACGVQTKQAVNLIKSENSFLEVNLNENSFVLDSVFPEIKPEWIHKIKVSGKIKENTPKGTYSISVNPDNPLILIDKNFFELRVVVK